MSVKNADRNHRQEIRRRMTGRLLALDYALTAIKPGYKPPTR